MTIRLLQQVTTRKQRPLPQSLTRDTLTRVAVNQSRPSAVEQGDSLDNNVQRAATVDLGALTKDEREALARDRATAPAVLADLANYFYLLPALAANPSTPEETLRGIYRDFPHMRPADTGPLGAAPDDDVEGAIASFRRRQASTPRYAYSTSRPASSTSRPARSSAQYVQVLDSSGRTVHVPVGALRGGRTNGLAIASFVLSLVGGSLLAVILGHIAKSQIAQAGDDGDGLATAGLAIGYISIAIFLIAVIALVAL